MDIKVTSKVGKEEYENLLNKIYNYIIDYHNNEYKQKKEHTEYEKGLHMAYWTILDTMKNQVIVSDDIKTDVDIEKICSDFLIDY